ncbi:MAG TPA: long-chain fatty acid--CoA ligase [Candidatus Acidoferrales bacterium]
MSYAPLPQRFLEMARTQPLERAQLFKVGDRWEATSSAELLRRAAGLSAALAELGVSAGDRVALLSANRPEWHVADFAILGLGAVSVPLYFRESAERIVYILNDSGARVAIAVGEEQVAALVGVRDQLKTVAHIIVGGVPAGGDGNVLHLDTLLAGAGDAHIAAYAQRAATVKPEDLATIIYTSGTTGEPKGVMLTHLNLSSNTSESIAEHNHGPGDVALSFLPLSHVYERTIDYTYLFYGVTVAYVDRMEALPAALLEVKPTMMAAVPRVFEKVYGNIVDKGRQATGSKRKIFDWAMGVAHKAVPWRGYAQRVGFNIRVQWHIADALVYKKIRAGIGGNIRHFISGAAPLAKELLEFYWSVGIPVYQGYGQTETSPVVSTNTPKHNKLGTVGPPLRGVEVRIADDGEILVRGALVMKGYWNKPEATREVVGEDGWLATGDIGFVDPDGYLSITDRKKDLIKTAAGKFVAPQPIENKLKTSPYISNAAVVGDRRKFIAALLAPNFAAVAAKAREVGLEFTSNTELAAHPWVRELIQGEVDRLTAHLAQFEKVKRFALVDHDFTFDGGQLTYTMKLKRRVIEEKYAGEIAEMYADVEEPRPQPL